MNELLTDSVLPMANRHVLFPVYDMKDSRKAFRWFAENVANTGDRLFFVRIMPSQHNLSVKSDESYFIDQTNNTYGMVNSIEPLVRDRLLEHAKMLYEAFNSDVRILSKNFQNSITQIALVKSQGHVGKAILEAQEYFRIDLIVMAPRDKSSFRRMFANRTSDYVCHNTHIPVIFIPSNNLKFKSFDDDSDSDVGQCGGSRQSCGLFKI